MVKIRKYIKYYIFPFFYNLTVIGIKDKLIIDCDLSIDEGDELSYVMKAAHVIFKAISNSSNDIVKIKDLLNSIIKKITKFSSMVDPKDRSKYSIFFNFKDSLTSLEYKLKTRKQISIYQKSLGYSVTRTVPCLSDDIDIESQSRATLSLFIQSCDARLLFLINKIGYEKYGETFLHIHDCHLSNLNEFFNLFVVIKDAFYELFFKDSITNKNILEISFLEPTLSKGNLSLKNKASIQLF
jgi:hypothetical protein